MSRIWVVGTADTKGDELAFLAARIRELGGEPVVVDVGTRAPTIGPDIPAGEVAADGEPGLRELADRGEAVSGMGAAFAAFIARKFREEPFAGVVGIGGGGDSQPSLYHRATASR